MAKFTLVFTAHDTKKEDLIHFVKAYSELLTGFELVATRNTGWMIHQSTGLPVTILNSSLYGGIQQIGALVANNKVDAVFLLREPLIVQAHEPDIIALTRLCDVHNVILATNLATSEAILRFFYNRVSSPIKQDLVSECEEELVGV